MTIHIVKKTVQKILKKTVLQVLYAMPEILKLLKILKLMNIILPHPRLLLSALDPIVLIAKPPYWA